MGLLDQIYGYQVRQPYKSEADYFSKNKNVAGMAAEDNKVVLNPYSGLGENEQNSVIRNEAARLWMKNSNFAPPFYVTPEQKQAFAGTPYENNQSALRQTLMARILSGDPSAGQTTPEQQSYTNLLKGLLGN